MALPLAAQPGAPRAADLEVGRSGRTARLPGPVRRRVLSGQSSAPDPRSAVRSWPLLVLAAPAAAEVWSGWVGIAARTGFGLVSPLPGIWPSLHIDTTITLPVGVEAYAAYAWRAWLAPAGAVSARTRRFARRSAIFSFTLGAAGQVAYHLLEQARITQAPWPVTTIVSCLPVLVLAMGTALAHMLRADASAAGPVGDGTGEADAEPSLAWSRADQAGRDRLAVNVQPTVSGPPAGTTVPSQVNRENAADPRTQAILPPTDQARLIASRLAAIGKPVSRRALRSGGVKGSNSSLNALACALNTELAEGADTGS
jgi:hypothetical protein